MRLQAVAAVLVVTVGAVRASSASYRDQKRVGWYGVPDQTGTNRGTSAMAAMSEADRQELMATAGQRSGACPAQWAGNHSLETPHTCTRAHDRRWAYYTPQCSCRPRQAIVPLQMAATSDIIQPSVVVVKRCSGWCSTMGQTCMALETGEIAVTLVHYDMSNSRRCGDVRVQEHRLCRCGCPLQASDCSDQQVFRPDLCMCRCKSAVRRDCEAGRRWDSRQCRCVCQEHKECSTGFGWSSDYCSCLEVKMPPVDGQPRSTDDSSERNDEGSSGYH